VVVKQPQSTRVEEPTLLCNQVRPSTHMDGYRVYQDLASEKVRRRAYVRLVTNIDMPHGL